MNWKRWKMGLLISLLSGLFTGLIGLALNMTAKEIGIFVLISIAKDGQLYLAKHPAEQISFDTDQIKNPKPDNEKTT